MKNLILLPRPRRVEQLQGSWKPPVGLADQLDAFRFADCLPDTLSTREGQSEGGEAGSYTIRTGPDGVLIEAAEDEGRWNAVQTLRQMLCQSGRVRPLPSLHIDDSPAFAHRDIMLDVSRTRVPTMRTLKNLIDIWASLKINRLQIYIEHTFAYSGHETVWENASPFTGAEIQRIDEYCQQRGVELVPNQNSFGHMERWLRHPAYHRYAEAPGGFVDPWGVRREHASTLNLAKDETMDFLRDLYDQLLPNFSSRSFNIGGDEPYDLGAGDNAARCRNEGRSTVYLKFLLQIIDEVESRGYVPQYWADIALSYPELVDRLPRNAVAMNWGYEADHPFDKETTLLAEAGLRFQVCPGTASWNGLAPRWHTAVENLRSAAEWGLQNGAEGYLVTDWGDNGHMQQYVASMPGWFAGAAAAWEGPRGALGPVEQALQIHLFDQEHAGQGGGEAAQLMELCSLHTENPVYLHNMSYLVLPLLDHDFTYCRSRYTEISRAGMGRAAEIAAELSESLGELSGRRSWRDQLVFTARLVSFAADLAGPFYATDNFRIENIDANLRRSLARRLRNLLGDYAELWRLFCRPGGLPESLGRFNGLLSLLESGS